MNKDEADTNAEVVSRAVLLDLEQVAIPGHEVRYQALESALAGHGVTLTQGLFAQHCLAASADWAFVAVLKKAAKKAAASERDIKSVRAAVLTAYTADEISLDSAVMKLLEKARKRGMSTGALSGLDDAGALALSIKLGLPELGTQVVAERGEDGMPGPDAWLTLAKAMGVPPSRCAAVTATAVSCKAAVAAGMKCAVLLNKFNTCEDFGGADFVWDAIDDRSMAELFAFLEAH